MVPRSVAHEVLVQAQQMVPRNQTVRCWTGLWSGPLSRQGPEVVEICKSFESVTHHDVSKYDCLETTSTCFCMCVSDYSSTLCTFSTALALERPEITPALTACIRVCAETQQHAC